jgi:ketosteroid isomerase-like protein
MEARRERLAAPERANSDTRVNAREELRELVDERVRAVRTKDVTAIRARPADDVITFDVLPPLNSRGSAGVIEHMQEWFDGYDGPIDFSVHAVNIDAEGDIGFCSFVYHVGGTLTTGGQVDMWVRATLCCRKINERWRIVHDHESVPFDPATGQAQISLAPH